MKILVVDDHAPSRTAIADVVEYLGHESAMCEDGAAAVAYCSQTPVPLVITDLRMPKLGGMELLSALGAMESMAQSDIIVCTGHGDMESAVEAMKRGAYDYLTKPVNPKELGLVIKRAAEHQMLLRENTALSDNFEREVSAVTQVLRRELEQTRKKLLEVAGVGEIVTASPAMKKILGEIEMYRKDPYVPVLIEGETGTGKEVVARLIHFDEDAPETPLVDLNCSAIAPDLFESELFGYAPGAFTGSRKEGHPGKLELAKNGTLFLDEVGDLPLSMQPKLLRVLETRSFYRVGGARKINFEGRIVCATNVDLQQAVEAGQFRRDLFHRFNVGHIVIPPLRERRQEIEPLARLFMKRFSTRRGKRFHDIHPEAIAILYQYAWPGNIRELENTIDRTVLMHDAEFLLPDHISVLTESHENLSGSLSPDDTDQQPVLELDRFVLPDEALDLEALNNEIVRLALEKFDGNKSQAAKYLGLSRGAFRNRLDKLS